MFTGVLDLPWWGYVVYTLVVTHITIAAVTILPAPLPGAPGARSASRCQPFLPLLAVAHDRHGHEGMDRDPPQAPRAVRDRGRPAQPADRRHPQGAVGRRRALSQGRRATAETLERYGARHAGRLDRAQHLHAARSLGLLPDAGDRISCCSASSASRSGPCRCCGFPFFAAGVINGIGHYWGYRNFQPRGRQHEHRAVGHPDRRRRAAQQSPRVSPPRRASRTAGTSSTSAGSTSALLGALGLAQVKKVAPAGQARHRQDALRPRHAAGGDHAPLRRARAGTPGRCARPAPTRSRT